MQNTKKIIDSLKVNDNIVQQTFYFKANFSLIQQAYPNSNRIHKMIKTLTNLY
jgi:hypothetical protein